ncbi:MAG: TatD family hydrolase, partial [Desulfobacula sp.]
MILFDSHSHIDDKAYEKDLEAVIERAERENVFGIMIVGIDISTSLKAIKIAHNHNRIITSVGIHPHDAAQCSRDALDTLVCFAKENSCVKAWGET